ncbi:MAG TPA: WD40 repeat domain-containing protein, partial [Candidatus Acidoferrum sp.]|nr:WD40 repeat domain-containing protein [Candidatus Acidoferrum sp.]
LQHGLWVLHGEFSPDGARVVTTSHDRSVRVWDVRTHQMIGRPMDHRDGVRRASFSPDGSKIVSGANDETVVLWNSQTGRPLRAKVNHDKPVMDVAFDPSGRLLATADHGGTVKVWDTESMPMIEAGDTHFSADGRRSVTIANGSFSISETVSRVVLATNISLDRPVVEAIFSADGDRLVFHSRTGAESWVCVADRAAGFRPRQWFAIGAATNLASSDGSVAFVATPGAKEFSLWNLSTSTRISEPVRVSSRKPRAAFSADGSIVAVLDAKRVHFFNSANGKTARPTLDHDHEVEVAAFTRNGQHLLTASRDTFYTACAARIWNVNDSNVIAGPFGHDDGVLDARFSTDESLVLTASEDQYARVWDVKTGQLLVRSERHGAQVKLARFNADSSAFLTVAGDQTLRILETATGSPLAAPISFAEEVTSAGFFRDSSAIWVRLKGRALKLELTRTSYTAEHLKELIGALGTSQIMRGRGAWSAADADAWRGALNRVVEPGKFQQCLDDLPRWHEIQAIFFEQRKSWSAARFHYQRLQELVPGNASYSSRLRAVEKLLPSPVTSP